MAGTGSMSASNISPSPTSRRMTGKVAVVTGSTQGLGEMIARQFVAEGATGIVLTGRNRARGEKVKSALERAGTKVVFVEADLAQVDSAKKIMAATDESFGRIDTLVNSAAITDRGTILDTTPEFFDQMMAINLTLCCNH